jgi:hypothetical protein
MSASHFASNQKNAMEAFEMLKEAFGEETVGRTPVFELFSRLRSCVTSVKDAGSSGYPSMSKKG